MINYKKLANIFKNSSQFLIWRKGEDEYLVTNTYLIIRLDQQTFNKMKAKYSSYKNTPYVKELGIDEFVSIYNKSITDQEKPNLEEVLDDSGAKKAIVTKLILNQGDKNLLYVVDGEFGMISKKYFDLFGYDKKYKTVNTRSPLMVYDVEKLIAAVMPIRNESLQNLDGISLLKAQLDGDQ